MSEQQQSNPNPSTGAGQWEGAADTAVFASTYYEAREKFVEAATNAGAELHAEVLPDRRGADGEDLVIDFALLRVDKDAPLQRVLLVSCGVHGVEGFAGSAVLVDVVLNLWPRLRASLRPGHALVLVHAVNPFGMSWWRRWNENNVDLNRNLLRPEEFADLKKRGVDSLYARFGALLNPTSVGPDAAFFARVLAVFARFGKANAKQALARGQYVRPKWLFYGGSELEWSHRVTLQYLDSIGMHPNAALQRVAHVDLHTGLGPKGHVSLLASNEPDYEDLCAALGGPEGDGYHVEPQVLANNEGVAYDHVGSFRLGLCSRLAPDACRWLSFTQEFGTLPGVLVVKALRAENAAYHNNPSTPLSAPEKLACLRAFHVDAEDWRVAVLQGGRRVVGAMQGFVFDQ